MSEEAEEAARQWGELDPATRAFLGRLRPDDIPLIEEGITLTRSVMTVGRVMRAMLIFVTAAMVGAMALWDAWAKLAARVRGVGN